MPRNGARTGIDADASPVAAVADAPATTLTQSERTEASRRALIDATISLLAREGYRAASIARIQEESGLSRGLVTYHFGSKLKLMEAVANRIRDDYAEETTALYAGKNGREQVQIMFHSYLTRVLKHPEPSHVMLVLAADSISEAPELRSAVQDVYRSFRSNIERMLRDGIADGSVRKDVDPRVQSTILHAILRGMVLQYFLDPTRVDVRKVRSSMPAIIDRQLAP